ncbi:hypothetical protein LTR17_015439 [Elasticomyces elasticus]|nr:hypothetical protein LTR17_015439 [Elasticomyces elasticus]
MSTTTFTTFDSFYAHLTTTYSYPVLASQSPNPYSKALSHSIASLSIHPTLESLLHILNGDLSSAHFLCRHMQNEPAWEGMYIHGLLHRVEGDYRNAEAWYGNVAETECFQYAWGGEHGLEDAKAFIRRIEKLRKEKVGSLDELEGESKREVDALVEWCKRKFGTGKMEDASQAWVEPSEEHHQDFCIMPLPIFTKAEWDAWFDANPQDEEQGDAPLGGEMRTASLPPRESTPRPVFLTERQIGAMTSTYGDMVAAPTPRRSNQRSGGPAELDGYLQAEEQRDAPLGGEMVSTSLPPGESTPRYEDRRVFNNERVASATTSAYGDMTAVPATRPLRAERPGDAPLGGKRRSKQLKPRENRARREEMDAPPSRPLRAKRPGDAPLRGERRISPRQPRESTPRYEDRPVPSTERYIAAGTSAYDDMMAAPPPRSRNEAELAAKLAEFQAYLRAEAQRNAPLGGGMRSTPQGPREKRARREEQPVQSTEWNLVAGTFDYGDGTFTNGNMMAASPPTPRSEGSGWPMTMPPPPKWRVDLAARWSQRPRRDMAHESPLDSSPTMSQPPPLGMAIPHPPGEPQANFASTLPHRPGPGIAPGYNLGAAPTMSQPPAFGMAGGHAPASLMEHSAFGQPGPFQDMPGDPSPDDWVFMGFSGNPKMMMEANAFAMLAPQNLASAPAAQAPGSRGPYAEPHHPYQPQSSFPLQTGFQSGGYQSPFQGFHGMRNTEAPQPSGYAAPYGHMQPTQLPMDPQQMYQAPSMSPVANTMAPQASVHAAP